MRPVALALVLALVAGCVAPPAPPPASVPVQGLALVAHDSHGARPAPPEAWKVRFSVVAKGGDEPSIGVTKDETVFVAGVYNDRTNHPAYRSRDHAHSWEPVGDPLTTPHANEDPWLWVDPLTDRVFNVPLYIACSWLQYSDDRGASWQVVPDAGCGAPLHDHQKLTGGPPPAGVATKGYPNVLYYGYNSFRPGVPVVDLGPPVESTPPTEGSAVSVSLDGGATWSLPVKVHALDRCEQGFVGPVAVAADGTALLPKPTCDGVDVLRSRDAGATWQLAARVNGAGLLPVALVDPALAFDRAGNAFLAWPGKDGATYLAVSRDGGTTWSAPVRASPPQVTETVYTTLVAGAEGRVALVYLGTTADPAKLGNRDPSFAAPDVRWHLWFTFAEDALAADPVFASAQATPDDDPAQVGCVWLEGGVNDCRSGEFYGLAAGADGRPYVVFVDNCDHCAAQGKIARLETVAVVEEGPSLLGGRLEPLR